MGLPRCCCYFCCCFLFWGQGPGQQNNTTTCGRHVCVIVPGRNTTTGRGIIVRVIRVIVPGRNTNTSGRGIANHVIDIMILQIAAYFILASRKKGSFCYGSIYGGAIFIDRTTKYNHCLVTSTSTGMFVFESRNDSFNGIQNDGFTPIFSGFRHADRLINYVIYATFQTEVLYY